MKKFVLMLIGLFMAANVAVCQAEQVPLYERNAKDLYREIKLELEAIPTANCKVKKFQRVSELDDKDAKLKFWACDLLRKTDKRAKAKIMFAANGNSEVQYVLVCCGREIFEAEKSEMATMMLITSIGFLEVFGADEEELTAIVHDINENPSKGSWGILSDDTYFELEFGKDDKVAGFALRAYRE